MKFVVLDIGGLSLKIWKPFASNSEKIETGTEVTSHDMVRGFETVLGDLAPDRVSIGYPGLVRCGRPAEELVNLVLAAHDTASPTASADDTRLNEHSHQRS